MGRVAVGHSEGGTWTFPGLGGLREVACKGAARGAVEALKTEWRLVKSWGCWSQFLSLAARPCARDSTHLCIGFLIYRRGTVPLAVSEPGENELRP